MKTFEMLRIAVENILLHPHEFEWSAQGLGMLRVYFKPNVRLHVWDRSLLVPGASPLHTHPWDFTSTIIAGRMLNRRYVRWDGGVYGRDSKEAWNQVQIKCGEGAHTVGDSSEIMMVPQPDEHYSQEFEYSQSSDEIHWSMPEDGTVTICERVFKQDTEHAYVFWRGSRGWVDAKPRKATRKEVAAVCDRALGTWF